MLTIAASIFKIEKAHTAAIHSFTGMLCEVDGTSSLSMLLFFNVIVVSSVWRFFFTVIRSALYSPHHPPNREKSLPIKIIGRLFRNREEDCFTIFQIFGSTATVVVSFVPLSPPPPHHHRCHQLPVPLCSREPCAWSARLYSGLFFFTCT